MRSRAGHGTRSRYQVGCRCDDCRAANAEYIRVGRGGTPRLAPNTGRPRRISRPKHPLVGSARCYENGCRYYPCVLAHRRHQAWVKRRSQPKVKAPPLASSRPKPPAAPCDCESFRAKGLHACCSVCRECLT